MAKRESRIELPRCAYRSASARPRLYAADELVRFDARIPAGLAKELFNVALSDGRPEPWQVHLGGPVDDRPLDKATRTRGWHKRQDA